MKSSSRPSCALLLASACLLAGTAYSQSKWNGAGNDNLWSNPLNWEGSTAPISGNATVIQLQGNAGRYNPSIGAAFTMKSLTFNSAATPGAYTLSGADITLYGEGAGGSADSVFLLQNNSGATQTINNNIVLGGAGRVDAASGNLVLAGNINGNAQNGLRFVAGNGKAITLSGVISNISSNTVSYNDLISGGGQFYISGVNTYTAATNLFGGTYYIGANSLNGAAGAFGNASSQIMVGAANRSATLYTNGGYAIGRNLRLSSSAVSVTLGGITSDVSTYSGYIYLGELNSAARGVKLTAEAGGQVRIGTGAAGVGGLLRSTGATGSGDSVEKIGAGVVSIEAGSLNTYSGTTTVTAGTLLINGTLSAGGGDVTVNNTATLGGKGVIDRFTRVEAGGILSAGDLDASGVSLANTLSFGAGLWLDQASVLRFDLGSTQRDLISVTGNLALGGGLSVTALSGFGEGAFTLFTYTGTLANNELSVLVMPDGYTGSLDYSQTGSVILNVAAVPEPGALVLLGVGGLLLGWARVRKMGRTTR